MTGHRTGFQKFAMDVYGVDGVPSASVLLQDRCGVDVNVVLLAAYVGAAMGASFTRSDVAAVNARTRQWQDDVVRPLRAVRTRLLAGPPPAPNAATATLRERIKAVELDAETIELGELADFADRFDAAPAAGSADQRAAAAIEVAVSCGAAWERGPEERRAIAVIASAAARFGRE